MSRRGHAAALLLLFAGVVAAQPEAGAQACPDLSALQSSPGLQRAGWEKP